jgi:hypothetical protein
MAPEHPSRGHERSDLDPKRVTMVGLAILLSLGALAYAGTYLLFRYFNVREAPPGGSAASPPAELPPAPRLQTDPPVDLQGLRASEELRLRSYGWVNREQGIARIPIDRAMDLLVQRGIRIEPRGAAPAAARKPR